MSALATGWKPFGEVLPAECAPPEPPPFVDLRPLFEGDYSPEVPTVGEVLPGRCALYAGRLNSLHGEPSAGKSNIALSIAAAVAGAGGVVVYLDPEDTAKGLVNRAVGLSLDPAAIGANVRYLPNPDVPHYQAVAAWAKEGKPTLVVLDGLAEALAAEGLSEDKAADVLMFFRLRMRPLMESGAAVLVVDHVSKSSDNRGRWARGSGAKMGRYDGVVYGVELGKAYAPGVEGYVRLRISKDRHGGAGPQGKVAFEVSFGAKEGEGTALEWRVPEESGKFRPTTIMGKIRERLSSGPACNADLRKLGKTEAAVKALEILEEEGEIESFEEGRKKMWRLIS